MRGKVIATRRHLRELILPVTLFIYGRFRFWGGDNSLFDPNQGVTFVINVTGGVTFLIPSNMRVTIVFNRNKGGDKLSSTEKGG
jgi:hypothetical protein